MRAVGVLLGLVLAAPVRADESRFTGGAPEVRPERPAISWSASSGGAPSVIRLGSVNLQALLDGDEESRKERKAANEGPGSREERHAREAKIALAFGMRVGGILHAIAANGGIDIVARRELFLYLTAEACDLTPAVQDAMREREMSVTANASEFIVGSIDVPRLVSADRKARAALKKSDERSKGRKTAASRKREQAILARVEEDTREFLVSAGRNAGYAFIVRSDLFLYANPRIRDVTEEAGVRSGALPTAEVLPGTIGYVDVPRIVEGCAWLKAGRQEIEDGTTTELELIARLETAVRGALARICDPAKHAFVARGDLFYRWPPSAIDFTDDVLKLI